MQRTRWEIVRVLKRRGAATVDELARSVGFKPITVRAHLQVLRREQLVKVEEVRGRVGRPHHRYSLTDRAERLFTHHYHTLANDLLTVLADVAGEEQRDAICDRVADRMALPHLDRLADRPISERVTETVRILGETGILADSEPIDGGYLIREYTCPYYEVAQEHRCICRLDRRYLSNLAGAPIQQLTHLLNGGTCCAFLVPEPSSPRGDGRVASEEAPAGDQERTPALAGVPGEAAG